VLQLAAGTHTDCSGADGVLIEHELAVHGEVGGNTIVKCTGRALSFSNVNALVQDIKFVGGFHAAGGAALYVSSSNPVDQVHSVSRCVFQDQRSLDGGAAVDLRYTGDVIRNNSIIFSSSVFVNGRSSGNFSSAAFAGAVSLLYAGSDNGLVTTPICSKVVHLQTTTEAKI
jgi:hypothetical protein